MLKLTTDKHEASRRLSATAELLIASCHSHVRQKRTWRHSVFTWLQCMLKNSLRKIMGLSKILIKNLRDSKATGGTAPKKN